MNKTTSKFLSCFLMKTLGVVFFFCCSQSLYSQYFVSENPFQDHYFIENKGQFGTYNGKKVLFELSDKADKIYILEDGYLWLRAFPNPSSDTLSYHVSTIQSQFLGCNSQAKVIATGKTSHYFTYGNADFMPNGYEQITLTNFYPHIDLVYSFGTSGEGFKYSFKIHPGGNPNQIQFQYNSPQKIRYLNIDTTLKISNTEFALQESGLTVIHQNKVLKANYQMKKGRIGFYIPNFKMGMKLYIDPWVRAVDTLNRTINLYSVNMGENIAFDVDFDSKGNVFAFGGCPIGGNLLKLAKYDPSGQLIWVFQGETFVPGHQIHWYSTSKFRLDFMGGFIVDRSFDKIYLSDAWGSPLDGNLIIRLDSNGLSDSFLIHHPGMVTASKFLYRCDPHRIVSFGGFNHRDYEWTNVFEILDTNVYKPKTFKIKNKGEYDLIMDAATDDSNQVYVLIKGYSQPYSATNNSNNVDVLAKLSDSLNSTIWYDTLPTKIDQYFIKPYVPTLIFPKRQLGRGTNSIAATKNYIYYYDGRYLAAYNKNNGSLRCLDSLEGKTQSFQQGIVADNCGNVVIGADSGRLKVFKFNDTSFQWVKNIQVFPNTPRCVLDLTLDKDRNLLVFSGDSMVGTAINPVDCDASKATEFYVYPQKRCSHFAFAEVMYPDTAKSYTFTWFDSTTNEVVQKVTKFQTYRDTFFKRNPTHSYLVSIKQEDGCYSLVSNFWLSAIPKYDTAINVDLCIGEAYRHGDKIFQSDTQFIDSFITFFGCDSIVRYSLTFKSHSDTKQKRNICRGDTVIVGNSHYSVSGNYTDTLINFLGCDSVVFTEVNVLFDSVVHYKLICDGTGYRVGGKIYDQSGIYVDTFLNMMGCDSIVTTHLTVSRDTTMTFTPKICSGDSIKVGNSFYSVSGSYVDSFKRISGCDSIIVTELTVYQDTLIRNVITICEGDTVKVGNKAYYLTDTYHDTLLRSTGCDSIVITELKVFSKNKEVQRIVLCSKDSIEIDGTIYNQSTQFDKIYKNSNGCDSTVTYTIQKRNIVADFEIDSSQNPFFEFKNASTENVKFYWDFGDYAIDSLNRNTSHRYKNDRSYSARVCLTIVDSFGCADTLCKRVNISKLLYYLFNTFTPGNDGKNDRFKIEYKGGTFNYNLMIYNRWGALVYETYNAHVADESKLWNGNVMNTDLECPSGSYFVLYQLYLDGPENPPKELHGVITLIR
jgi:gliding motility-associated-like protein